MRRDHTHDRVFLIARACSRGSNALDGCSAAARVVQDSRRDKVVNLDELRPIARLFRDLAGLAEAVRILRLIGNELNWHQASPTWSREGDQKLYQDLCVAIGAAQPQDQATYPTESDCSTQYAIYLGWAASLFERAMTGEIDLHDEVINQQATACYTAMMHYVLGG